MTLGKIHTYPENPRVFKALIAAKYNNVQVDVDTTFEFDVTNATPEFLSKFPLGKVPAFESKDGPIYESNAIAHYVALAKKDTQLFGKSNYESALVQQFINFADNEIAPAVAAWLYPILGYIPYNKVNEKKAQDDIVKVFHVLNKILRTRTYLVGETITLADICMICTVYSLYLRVLEPSFRAPFVNVNRWFVTCVNQPEFKAVLGEVELCSQMEKYVPKKVQAEEKPKVESKKPEAAAACADEEEEEKPAPKPKNPLDSLPPSSFDLDSWKRFYSNNEVRPNSVDYFWTNFDNQGYSMWQLKYKYNDELAKIFMSCNLITGLYQRMERLRKYAFGSMIVFGEDNANEISGMFIFRGSEIPPDMKDVPDFESYDFIRIDVNDAAKKELWNDYLAWDGKFEGGKPFAEGKIFK